jgi:hypothetical protein
VVTQRLVDFAQGFPSVDENDPFAVPPVAAIEKPVNEHQATGIEVPLNIRVVFKSGFLTMSFPNTRVSPRAGGRNPADDRLALVHEWKYAQVLATGWTSIRPGWKDAA